MPKINWRVEVKVSLDNGQASSIQFEARDLPTLRDVEAAFTRVLNMCHLLRGDREGGLQ